MGVGVLLFSYLVLTLLFSSDSVTQWTAASLELCAPNNKNVNIVLKLFVPLKNKSDHTKEFYGKMVTQIHIY